MGNWGGGASIGQLYQFKDEHDLKRMGSCWMAGRVRIGDVALCLQHSGDCFHTYILMERYANGLKGIPGARFGACTFGEQLMPRLSERAFHLLAAGEFVKTEELSDESVLADVGAV